jgi:hypothetical protein
MSSIGSAIGGALGLISSKKSSDSAKDAASTSAEGQVQAAQIAADSALPWSTTGTGGYATFDEEGRTADLGLNPELQNIYDGMLSRSHTWQPMIQDFINDPWGAQDALYNQLKEVYAPQQERERLSMEKRLLSQGLFGQGEGEAGANPHMQALLEAQQMQDLNLRNQSMSQVQSLIDKYLGRQTADIGQATGLLDVPIQYANVGTGIGGNLASGGNAAAEILSNSAVNSAAANAAADSSMWNTLRSYTPQIGDAFNTVFNPSSVGTSMPSNIGPFSNSWDTNYATTADFNLPW